MKIGSIFLSSILVSLLLAVFVLEGDLSAAQRQQEIAVINMQKVSGRAEGHGEAQ